MVVKKLNYKYDKLKQHYRKKKQLLLEKLNNNDTSYGNIIARRQAAGLDV